MANCLVTGGAGFIGSHITEHLLAEGHYVRVVDNLITGKKENIGHLFDNIEFVTGDISDFDIARSVTADMDIVFHHAAIASVPRSVDDPVESNTANANGTLALLMASRDAKIRRFIYAGSSSAYGNSDALPITETTPVDPLSPYAVSKLTGEMYCKIFYSLYGLETVALRYFNVFGPRQDPNSEYAAVVPKFVTMMLDGRSPVIFGDGLQSRDFSYVRNSVVANMLAASAPKAPGEVFNIACGKAFSLLDLVAKINDILGTKINPQFQSARTGEVKHSLADITKARELLGYEPAVSLDNGLSMLIEFINMLLGSMAV